MRAGHASALIPSQGRTFPWKPLYILPGMILLFVLSFPHESGDNKTAHR